MSSTKGFGVTKNDNRRTGIGYSERSDLSDHHMCGTMFDRIACGRSDRQYFSDRNIHSGADIDVCTEDRGSFCDNDDLWFLDVG
jgi:hypothetical protein